MEKVVLQLSSTVCWIILLYCQLLFSICNVQALYCRNCTRIGRMNSGIETNCHTDCEGDICGIVQWRENDLIHIYESCISGLNLTDIKMGCRKNEAGATLCLCRDFHECNDIAWREKLAQMLAINLPKLECFDHTQTSLNETNDNHTEKCKANFCFYEQSMNTNLGDKALQQTVVSSSCGKPSQYLFDIDLFPRWPVPAMLPGDCFLTQVRTDNPTLRCMCNEDNCNHKPLYTIIPGNVTCALYDSTSETLTTNSCVGHFCFIQRTYPPYFEYRESKGCLSVSENDYGFTITVGYQNIMGLEQWFCNDDFCNIQIGYAEQSAGISTAAEHFTVYANFTLPLLLILLYNTVYRIPKDTNYILFNY